LSVYNSNAWSYYGETIRGDIGFYAIVSDGTTQRAYYNGVQLGNDATITALDWDSITEMALGSNNNGTGNFFDGQIAGFKIFNTALTAAQVADLYLNPEKIVPDGVADSALKLWLPMMEGAGTTAYDGSGNGNHGTISGATWVSGIGAPVAQTALVSWNKGQNKFAQSNDFSESAWNLKNGTFTKGVLDPIGNNEAWSWTATNADPYFYQQISVSGSHTISIWAKGVGSTIGKNFEVRVAATMQSFVLTSEWQRLELDGTPSNTNLGFEYGNPAVVGDVVHIFGAQLQEGSTAGPYVPTLATAQTSPVLLPQGLTANKDITGVNAFESARNPYALNLDGASWGEVHDNASLDFGTGSFTLEAWVKAKYVNQGSGVNAALSLGGDGAAYSAMFVKSNNVFSFYYNGFFINSSAQTEGDWVHIVGTYDETNQTLYIDGLQVAQNARGAADITNALVKQIGRDTNANRFYQDQIAQPRIYNRALTATEVLRNYNADKSKFGL
jgi:hypothetical protein